MICQLSLIDNHVEVKSKQTISDTLKLLVDTGNDLNIVKLSSLKPETLVDESVKYHLLGINDHSIQTLGKTILHLQIGKNTFKTEFHVVHSHFKILSNGILGKPFLKNTQSSINFRENKLTMEETQTVTLPPRSESIIAMSVAENLNTKSLIIHSQNIMKNVYLGNTINQVKNNRVLVSVINSAEHHVTLSSTKLEKSHYEIFEETSVHVVHSEHPSHNAKASRVQLLKENLRTEHLNREEKESVEELCVNFSDIFHLEGDSLSCTDAVLHEIITPANIPPINQRPYRLPLKHKLEINEQMEKLEKDQIIAPSKSPWNAPLLVVPKKPDQNGIVKYRVCVDFRKLNDITTGDAYPLPNMSDILDQLGKSKYYTTLDLAQGYHQVQMHPEHREKTAFSTDKGHYEFLRVPFGLKGAPALFQRLMNTVLTGMIGLKAFVYLDDIIVYATSISDHTKKLTEVFSRIRKFNLKLQPTKCEFMRKEVTFLGHVITDQGVKPDPRKTKCVLEFPVPTNVKQVKSFLGLSGYYRRFVPNYGQISKPLTSLLKQDVPFIWSDLCQESFEKLKKILTSEPLLQYPDFTQPFNLTCDASGYAIGCVLSQGPIGKDLPIAYASRTLNKAEINYSTTEKELCAIVWGIKQFRCYLFGQKFKIITDHKSLTWLFGVKDPGSRLMRWRLKLEEYEYEIFYKSGTNNTNADSLSRIQRVVTRSENQKNKSLDEESQQLSDSEHQLSEPSTSQNTSNGITFTENLLNLKNMASISNIQEISGDIFSAETDYALAHCVSKDFKLNKGIALEFRRKFGRIKDLQSQEKKIGEIAHIIDNNRCILYMITKNHFYEKPCYENMFQTIQNLRKHCEENQITKLAMPQIGCGLDELDWKIVRGMLRQIFRDSNINIQIYNKISLTTEQQQKLIEEHHNNPLAGHQGTERTYQLLRTNYSWEGMRSQVTEFVRKCPQCQINKHSNKSAREPMVITSTSSRPFQKIFMDIVGPLPRSHQNHVYIITLQDDLTKFSWAVPSENHEAATVARHFVEKFVCLHGIPESIVTDCGTEFLSQVFTEVCRLLKIKKSTTTPYHPQSNGSLERSHKTLGEYLRNFIGKDPLSWDTLIPFAMFVYNATIHSSTGFQPYELVYGRKISLPTSFTKSPEPQYNFKDYHFELKRHMQEAHAIAKENILKSKEKSKKYYDQKVSPQNIKVGDKVYIRASGNQGKLSPLWHGPYEVLEILKNNVNIAIKRKGKRQVVHRNLVKVHYS